MAKPLTVRRLFRPLILPLLALAASPLGAAGPVAQVAANRGFAELENEKPELAEASYREVVKLEPKDPLGHANLAISLLRQQRFDDALVAIERALELGPGRGELLAIRGEVRQWALDPEASLTDLAAAAAAAPDDLEIQYAAFTAATTFASEGSEDLAARSLARLAELRPDNLVVLLQVLQRAIAEADRAVASSALLRIRELTWQAPQIAERALGLVREALEGGEVASARVPAVRLENVLKVNPMFRESLRELKTGIQGIPVRAFLDQPPAVQFGDAKAVSFVVRALDSVPTASVAMANLDEDAAADLVRLRAAGGVDVRLAARADVPEVLGPAGAAGETSSDVRALDRVQLIDLDNDQRQDLLAFGADGAAVWLGRGDGSFRPAEDQMGLASAGAFAAVAFDFDIEGDLDLAMVGGASGPVDLWRNSLTGALERVGTLALPPVPDGLSRAVTASDLDRDGDLDLVLGHGRGVQWLENLRQGRFRDRTAAGGLTPSEAGVRAILAADLDNDGMPEVVTAGEGLAVWRNLGGRFEPWAMPGLPQSGVFEDLLAWDADNDGRRDLAAVGPGGLVILGNDGRGSWTPLEVTSPDGGPGVPLEGLRTLATADRDRDGDLDLVVGGSSGLYELENQGTDHHWLALELIGLERGNSKNNAFGLGSVVEVRVGNAYQFIEATRDVVHVGLGSHDTADVVRVVWTNGVPQNRLDLAGDQRIVEEQLLKGSCPFVYVWNGERFAFGTDLLWGSPIGLPAAPGVWVSSDPTELVRLDGLVPGGGEGDSETTYRLRITEELWEAAFFDRVLLWVVDHPENVEVASALRIIPGRETPEKVLGSSGLRPMVAAWDGRGRDVTERVARRDEVYADGYELSRYQGVSRPWTFTFDLGEAPAAPVRLHLDGWIFPADASLNLAVAQRPDLPYVPPRLEVETADGRWRELMSDFGFPAGKTKTLVVDTPALPEGARRLRLVTSLWLHWDRLAWTLERRDDAPVVRAKLEASRADLRYRGFSAPVRQAPNAPHTFDYRRTRLESPWVPFPGNYTRFGDVRPLLAESDDRTAILGPGDEIALEFDAAALEPVAEGWRRTFFLESHGWDKDADRNTFEAQQVEPLPFHAMSGYPYGEGETYPETPEHRRYVEEWLTRRMR
ncbi:MAG: FG-GAP-like repeat-containing protein [Acidobacteriota bacterium]